MNLQQLRYARALAECRSFNAAAERCGVSQPTLSNGIAQLELDLGRALFARTTRKVGLTSFGQELMPAIQEVLNAKAALMARAKQLVNPERQVLRIGVSPLIGMDLVDLLIEPFRRGNPAVEIVFREMNLAEMVRLLAAGQLEFVFGPVDGEAPLGPEWAQVRLHQEPLVYIGAGKPDGPQEAVVFAEIAAETFVMVPDTCGLAKATRALFRRNHVPLRAYPGEAMSYRVLQDWAQIGIGAAILPASKVPSGHGARILEDGRQTDGLQIAYQVIWHLGQDHSLGTMKMAKYLGEVAPVIAQGLR